MRLAFALIASSMLAVSGCAPTQLDRRQITVGQSFGFAFPAKVVEVLVVKAQVEVRDRFTAVGAEAARLTAQDAFSGRPLIEFISQLYAALGGAYTEDIEEFIRSTRCMYFLVPNDPEIFDKIQREILIQRSESENERIINRGVSAPPAGKTPSTSSPPVLTLPQACDERILPQSDVMMTYAVSGGTIHPITQALAQVTLEERVKQAAAVKE